MLELSELKRLHDKGYDQNQLTRERAADDLVFYHITQWDDNLLDQNNLSFRGQFDVLRKAGRQIVADLRANPIQLNFEPSANSREDGADLIDGLYISDDRKNNSIESYDVASGEAVVCGIGAWEMYTKYESDRAGNENQIICRRPINEANNNCFWDPDAKRLDKSDADWVSILVPYTFDGYKAMSKKITGEDNPALSMSSFANPEESYVFPWASGKNEAIYVVRFYHREKVNDIVHTIMDPQGNPLLLLDSEITDIRDELEDAGYIFESEKTISRYQVTLYIASGIEILETTVIPCDYIPVVPMYGERSFVEGEEHWEGITRLAKDPQRLRNFQLSYLADIVSRSPRPKPIFFPEQVQGLEHMFAENGADNNYAYLLNKRKTPMGEELPLGPVGMMPETPMPNALAASIDLSRQAVEDVANPGLPQNIADPDLSGKAVIALQNRLDQQSMVYQQNLKHAKRRDGEIYASMASRIYDAPRTVILTLPDGTRKRQEIMEVIQDKETGNMVTLNDLTNMEFDVYAEIGESYTSQKDKTIDEINQDLATLEPGNPMREILLLKKYELMSGTNFDDVRDYARKKLIIMGIKKPETDEEIAMMQQQAQQGDQPDAAMVMAMAEQSKADAAHMKEQRMSVLDQARIATDNGNLQINAFKAQTDRAKIQVEAEKANAEIDYTRIKTIGEQVNNNIKLSDQFRARLDNPLRAVG